MCSWGEFTPKKEKHIVFITPTYVISDMKFTFLRMQEISPGSGCNGLLGTASWTSQRNISVSPYSLVFVGL